MFWIISGEGIFHGLANATNLPLFKVISDQLHHSTWNGFTFYDLIFPLFIFISGVSMPLSFSKKINSTNDKALAKRKIVSSILKRTLILIVLGIVVNGGLRFEGYQNTRFASVLGRIGVSCFFAALIYLYCKPVYRVVWFAALLLGYWVIMKLVPVPGFGPGVLTPEGNFSAYFDRLFLPGKLHRKVYDPEGLLSNIPAIATALLGIFTGSFLQLAASWNSRKRVLCMFVSGTTLVFLGLLWDQVFPINKTMWTSSFVLYAGGWSLLLFTLFYFIIDLSGIKKWSLPFVWVGTNSILIYMAAHGLVNFEASSGFLFGGLMKRTNVAWQPVILWTGVAVIQFALLYFLYRKKWFLKL